MGRALHTSWPFVVAFPAGPRVPRRRGYSAPAAAPLTDNDVAFLRLKNLVVDIGSVQRHFHRRLDGKEVVVVPMKHVASQDFYDSVLEELQAPDLTAVLVEGVMDDRAALAVEQAELVRLQREPDLGRRVVKAITAGTHWPPGTVESDIRGYGVPLDLAAKLHLTSQERYWRALLKCLMPHKVVPSDAFEQDIASQPDATGARLRRMQSLFDTMANTLKTHHRVAVCWGFHHTPQIEVGLLQLGFLASPRTQSRSYGWTAEAFAVYVRTLAMRGLYDARALAPDTPAAPDPPAAP